VQRAIPLRPLHQPAQFREILGGLDATGRTFLCEQRGHRSISRFNRRGVAVIDDRPASG
jgi:hypothetical protein